MITDKERDNIKKEAKAILDNFALALEKVKIKKKELKKPAGGYREEKEGMQNNPDFRSRVFENAPNKNGDCIIAEKKKW